MLHVANLGLAAKAKHRVEIFNLGAPEFCQVNDSIGWICESLAINPRRDYTGGNRGWIGDNPFIFLETKKIQSTGWKAQLTIREGILRTLRWLEANPWVFENRH